MKEYTYTPKQERFCQSYVRLGNMSEAYRDAYDASKMNSATIGSKASSMLAEDKFGTRVQEIRDSLLRRNQVTLDEILNELASMFRFDPAEMYDENGSLMPIHNMPAPVRKMIASMDTEEIFMGFGKKREVIGDVKKIKFYNKLEVVEKYMKYFGAYGKHNEQKVGDVIIYQLPDNGRGKPQKKKNEGK